MNRVIKFRVWNVNGNCMHQWPELVEKNKIHLLSNQQGAYPVMQFTGLKDVNGVEIYEFSEIDHVYEVNYKNGCYILMNISSGDIINLFDYLEMKNGQIEVTKEYAKI